MCRDCEVELQSIRLLDATHVNRVGNGAVQVDLTYAAPDAKPSFWASSIPVAGVVQGMVCPDCGLIQLYAVPKT